MNRKPVATGKWSKVENALIDELSQTYSPESNLVVLCQELHDRGLQRSNSQIKAKLKNNGYSSMFSSKVVLI